MRAAHRFAMALLLALPLGAGTHPTSAAPSAGTPKPQASPARLGPDGLRRVKELVTFVEQKPFDEKSADIRAALVKFISDAPDIEVTLHGKMLGDPAKMDRIYFPLVFGQSMFAMATYLIDHPIARSDDPEVQAAGVEGALRVYEAIRRLKKDATLAELDRIAELARAGKLAEHVKQVIAEDKNLQPLPRDAK